MRPAPIRIHMSNPRRDGVRLFPRVTPRIQGQRFLQTKSQRNVFVSSFLFSTLIILRCENTTVSIHHTPQPPTQVTSTSSAHLPKTTVSTAPQAHSSPFIRPRSHWYIQTSRSDAQHRVQRPRCVQHHTKPRVRGVHSDLLGVRSGSVIKEHIRTGVSHKRLVSRRGGGSHAEREGFGELDCVCPT